MSTPSKPTTAWVFPWKPKGKCAMEIQMLNNILRWDFAFELFSGV
jgi:hypothetical protein